MQSTKHGAKSKSSIGPAEALAMLESAIAYCQRAGLAVKGGNVGGALTLAIAGAALAESGRFVVAAQPQPAPVIYHRVSDMQGGEVAHE